jgi:hypothetical protein
VGGARGVELWRLEEGEAEVDQQRPTHGGGRKEGEEWGRGHVIPLHDRSRSKVTLQ